MASKLIDDLAIAPSEREAALLAKVARLERENAALTARNTDLLRSEQLQLLQSTALETAADAVIITNLKGDILWINPAFTALTGYSAAEVLGKNPRVLKSGLHTPEFYKDLWDTILSGKTWRGNFTNRRKDGSFYQDEHTITPVRSMDGKITHFIAILNDVTERKKAETALAESEHKFRTLFEAASDAIFILGHGVFVDCNAKAASLFGLPRELLIGKAPDDFMPPLQPDGRRSKDRLNTFLARVVTGEPDSAEWLHRHANGSLVHTDVHASRLELGGKVYVQAIVRDITEKKRTEEQLLWKTAFFEALANSCLDGILVVDNEGKKILHNPRMSEMWGVPQELADEVDDKRRFEWVCRQTRNPRQFAEKVAHLYAHPDEISCDEIELVNGRFFDRTSAPVRGRDGKYYGRIWVFRDITERKRTEKSLKLFRSLMEQSNDSIEVIDAETGGFLDVNAQAWQRLGYTHEEMLAMTVPEVAVGMPPFADIVKELKAAGSKVVEARIRRKDGSTIPVEVSSQYIELDRPYLLAVVRDISERKRAEEKIAEQADFLDKARDAIVVRDLEGKILFWNQGAERMHGWSRDEVLGRNIADILYPKPNEVEKYYHRILTEGQWTGEIVHLTKDRREINVEVHATLIRDNEGRPKSLLAINTDITEKKKIEAQVMRAQRTESIGTLAGGIAHDLNNILSPIMLSIATLREMSDNPEMGVLLQTIAASAKRGADIVRQVLSFTQGVEGERVAIESKRLLGDIERMIKDTFPKDIRLKFAVSDEVWKIWGDDTQVHQVLLNLCLNARDAMPNGGTLTIDAENCVLDEQYAAMNVQVKAGKYVRISVADTGVGMPPAIVDKVFEPFFTTKDPDEGTGLGLSTVMGIVKSHGGSIGVASEPGNGTTFLIHLPALDADADTADEPEDSAEAAMSLRGWGETILVVDDEASVLTTTSKALQVFGYRVLTASDGAEAVSVYVEHRDEIDLVLTDLVMPVMDGTATIHALMAIDPSIKIIAASGINEKSGANKSPGPGVKVVLPKPYTSATLLKTLRTILDLPKAA